MKFIYKIFIKPFLGKKHLQKLFFGLHFLALKGMNFGGGANYAQSGELNVVKRVNKALLSLKRRAVIFDVGANVGNYSLAAAGIFSSLPAGFDIYSFEPSAGTFATMSAAVKNNSSIHPVQAALSDTEGEATLYLDEQGSELASLSKRQLDYVGKELSISETVKLTTLDAFCAEKKITQIDFLKLDVEGHELSALAGAKGLLENGTIRFLQFEFGGGNIDTRTFFRDFYNLLNKKYDIFRVLKDGLEPIKKYREMDEIFITTNYFAQLKSQVS